jgi:HEAT repeats
VLLAASKLTAQDVGECIVPNKLLPFILLLMLAISNVRAQGIEAQFTVDKAIHFAGEPVFIALTVSNKGDKPVWVDFKSPEMPLFCHDFALEVSGAESAAEHWGCGFAGSCGRGFREVPPGKSISLQQLLNGEFRLDRLGGYTIHAHTAIDVHDQNLSDSREVQHLEVSDTLTVNLQGSNESQLVVAFQPFVEELDSSDSVKRSEAASAITQLAPPFLEDVLIQLTKSSYAYAAITALRKADTLKTRNELAHLATSSGDSTLRAEAISNLGRTNDVSYVPTLLGLLGSDDTQIQNAAAEAAGNLGGPTAVTRLAALLSSPGEETRLAGVNGLGQTHARQAVPFLIRVLLDSNANIRQAAVSGLWLLTHRAAFEGNQWADVKIPQSAIAVHQRWVLWWNSHGRDSKIHGMDDCDSTEPLD